MLIVMISLGLQLISAAHSLNVWLAYQIFDLP